MDVWGVFTGDSQLGTCGLLRSVYYRDYEQFPYGTLESHNNGNGGATNAPKDPYSKVQEKYRNNENTAKTRKQDCPFCKGNKRRPLINYLRKRDQHKYHDSIYEDEECDNKVEESSPSKTTNSQNNLTRTAFNSSDHVTTSNIDRP